MVRRFFLALISLIILPVVGDITGLDLGGHAFAQLGLGQGPTSFPTIGTCSGSDGPLESQNLGSPVFCRGYVVITKTLPSTICERSGGRQSLYYGRLLYHSISS